jgi:hypothetical protein
MIQKRKSMLSSNVGGAYLYNHQYSIMFYLLVVVATQLTNTFTTMTTIAHPSFNTLSHYAGLKTTNQFCEGQTSLLTSLLFPCNHYFFIQPIIPCKRCIHSKKLQFSTNCFSIPNNYLEVYGDSGPDYTKYNKQPASKLVVQLIVQKGAQLFWDNQFRRGMETDTLLQFFTAYCENQMIGEKPVEFFDNMYYNNKLDLVNGEGSLRFGGCTEIKGTRQSIVTAAMQDEKVLFYSFNPSSSMIDFRCNCPWIPSYLR